MRKPLLYQHMQAQGHLNDTIVVNQPRLTTDDDQIITVSNDVNYFLLSMELENKKKNGFGILYVGPQINKCSALIKT